MAAHKPENGGVFSWFIHSQVAGSVVLLSAAVLALILANTPLRDFYKTVAHLDLGFVIAGASYTLHLDHWVKDGLMAIFFFVVGLEIKRELVAGELSSFDKAILPVGAAVGGALVPALIYLSFNSSGPEARGWAVPMATDIAFALGVLAMFGKRVPIGLKVFLTALAIADDLLAVIVIALFYTAKIDFVGLIVAVAFMAAIFGANRFGVRPGWIYFVLAFGAWAGVLVSGVHATIAGVLVALLVPVTGRIEPSDFLERARTRLGALETSGLTKRSMIEDHDQLNAIDDLHEAAADLRPPGLTLEHALHPVQSFLVVPLFALFAAGVPLNLGAIGGGKGTIAFAIILGLVAGKLIGVTGASYLIVKSGRASLPAGVTWPQIVGASMLAGIGFTMSIFIAELGFIDEVMVNAAKIGILVASVTAGILGYLMLNRVLPKANADAT